MPGQIAQKFATVTVAYTQRACMQPRARPQGPSTTQSHKTEAMLLRTKPIAQPRAASGRSTSRPVRLADALAPSISINAHHLSSQVVFAPSSIRRSGHVLAPSTSGRLGDNADSSELREQLLIRGMAKLPGQAESLFNTERDELLSRPTDTATATKSISDLDYLSELLAIQQSDGPKNIGFFGTRNMGVTHQKLVEILSYAYASTGNHIYTSGSIGTNAAVIKGALRANCPDKLTVILPQSLKRQPAESQELLQQVGNIVEMPENDDLSLLEASRICNNKIIGRVQQVICFAFHDSRLLLETCHHAKDLRKIVTLFYLD